MTAVIVLTSSHRGDLHFADVVTVGRAQPLRKRVVGVIHDL